MEKLHRRKFLEEHGTAAVEIDIEPWTQHDGGFDASFRMSDSQDSVDFFWSFPAFQDDGSRENFSAAVKFFDTLRILSEEAIDDITARWVNMKLGGKGDEETFEKYEEESWEALLNGTDGGATAPTVQEELDVDPPAAEEERE